MGPSANYPADRGSQFPQENTMPAIPAEMNDNRDIRDEDYKMKEINKVWDTAKKDILFQD